MGEGPVSQARPSFRVLRCHGRGTQATVYKTVVSDCGPRTAAHEAGVLREGALLGPWALDPRPRAQTTSTCCSTNSPLSATRRAQNRLALGRAGPYPNKQLRASSRSHPSSLVLE